MSALAGWPGSPGGPSLAAIIGALPGAILVVGNAGVVTAVLPGSDPSIDLSDAAGQLLCEALGIDLASDDAGRWELWLACVLGHDLGMWPLNLGDMPRYVAQTGDRPALSIEVGPIVEDGRVVALALQLRRAELAPVPAVGSGPATTADERFTGDAHGILDDCEAELLKLSRDPGARQSVHRLFRSVHTLKGMAGGAGAATVVALTHRAEEILNRVRNSTGTLVDRDLADARGLLAEARLALGRTVGRGVPDAMTCMYAECRPLIPRLERVVATWSSRPRELQVADDLMRLLRGFADSAQRARCDALVARIEEVRSQITTACEMARPSRSLVAAIEHGVDDLSSWLRLYQDLHAEVRRHDTSNEVAIALTSSRTTAGDATAVAHLTAVAHDAGMLSLAAALRGDPDSQRRALAAVTDLPAMLSAAGIGTRKRSTEAARELDRAVRALAGDLEMAGSLAGSPLTEQVAPALARLRAAVVEVTWGPLDDIAERIIATSDAVAAETGKQVAIDFDAHGLRLPAHTRRAIAEILVHAVRNAIDHGIEAPAERIAAGKPTVGVLTVRIEVDEAWAQVVITDDGRGVEVERVRKRGAELGLLGASPAAATDAEVLELLFHPGFSTAGAVSAVSGRGVGMDAIRAFARGRGGDARLSTVPGRGTQVVVRLGLIESDDAMRGAGLTGRLLRIDQSPAA